MEIVRNKLERAPPMTVTQELWNWEGPQTTFKTPMIERASLEQLPNSGSNALGKH